LLLSSIKLVKLKIISLAWVLEIDLFRDGEGRTVVRVLKWGVFVYLWTDVSF